MVTPFYEIALSVLTMFALIAPIIYVLLDFALGHHAVRASKERDWKMLTCQMALYELQLTESINAMRKELHQPPIDYQPILHRPEFCNRLWTVLRHKAKTSTSLTVERLMNVIGKYNA